MKIYPKGVKFKWTWWEYRCYDEEECCRPSIYLECERISNTFIECIIDACKSKDKWPVAFEEDIFHILHVERLYPENHVDTMGIILRYGHIPYPSFEPFNLIQVSLIKNKYNDDVMGFQKKLYAFVECDFSPCDYEDDDSDFEDGCCDECREFTIVETPVGIKMPDSK